MKNTIETLVLPLKEEAIKRLSDFMMEKVDHTLALLVDNDWNINMIAPRPNYNDSNETHRAKSAKRNFIERITKRDHNRFITKGPDIVSKSEEGIERLMKEVADMASEQYIKFVAKLEAKIGSYEDASMEGNHIWGFSIITVQKADGSIEKWKTHTITNYSKFNLAFAQYPSKKMKV